MPRPPVLTQPRAVRTFAQDADPTQPHPRSGQGRHLRPLPGRRPPLAVPQLCGPPARSSSSVRIQSGQLKSALSRPPSPPLFWGCNSVAPRVLPEPSLVLAFLSLLLSWCSSLRHWSPELCPNPPPTLPGAHNRPPGALPTPLSPLPSLPVRPLELPFSLPFSFHQALDLVHLAVPLALPL